LSSQLAVGGRQKSRNRSARTVRCAIANSLQSGSKKGKPLRKDERVSTLTRDALVARSTRSPERSEIVRAFGAATTTTTGDRDGLERSSGRPGRRSAGATGDDPSRHKASDRLEPAGEQRIPLEDLGAPIAAQEAGKQRSHEQEGQPYQGGPEDLHQHSQENHTHVELPRGQPR
jgi:hypothetical protein